MLWRIIGSEHALLWIGLYPDHIARFVERINAFSLGILKAQIAAASGMLDGMVVWGDVAYKNGMLFSPAMWREHFKSIVKEQIRICHGAGIPVIYHGCGNASEIYGDFIEMGLDSYNPLEAKSGLDVVELRKKYGHAMGFCGNLDALSWANEGLPELGVLPRSTGTRSPSRWAIAASTRSREVNGAPRVRMDRPKRRVREDRRRAFAGGPARIRNARPRRCSVRSGRTVRGSRRPWPR